MATETYPIGIDLGTTYSSVAVFRYGKVEIITNDEGDKKTPSYVAFSDNDLYVGKIAKFESQQQPEDVVFDIKRLMGHSMDHPDVLSDILYLPFKIIEKAGKLNVKVSYRNKDASFTPEQISGAILAKMKQIAETRLEGELVSSAVVTVPAYFNHSQRRATLVAGKLAGFSQIYLLNEPTAAALAYAYSNKVDGSKNILIFDFGGGTLDVSIVNIAKQKCEVKATAGNSHLGGEDITINLANYLAGVLKDHTNIDITSDKKKMHKLRLECDDIKRALSTKSTHKFHFSTLYIDTKFAATVARAKFDELNKQIYVDILNPVRDALTYSKLKKDDIDKVILVGGSSKILKISEILSQFFGKDILKSIPPDTAIAYGAALHAARLNGFKVFDSKDFILQEVTSMSLSVGNSDGTVTVVIPKSTLIPHKVSIGRVTVEDDQELATFKIYEGESPYKNDNYLLGQFTLHGIPKAPQGTIGFILKYDIDNNSMLTVSSEYKNTGLKGEMKVQL